MKFAIIYTDSAGTPALEWFDVQEVAEARAVKLLKTTTAVHLVRRIAVAHAEAIWTRV